MLTTNYGMLGSIYPDPHSAAICTTAFPIPFAMTFGNFFNAPNSA
jgi:hypothetical protein